MAAVILGMEVMGVTSMPFLRMVGILQILHNHLQQFVGMPSDGIVTNLEMKDGSGAHGPFLDVNHMTTMGIFSNPNIRDIIDDFATRLPAYLFVVESRMRSAATSSELRCQLIKLKGAAVSCGFVEVARVAAECLADGVVPCEMRIDSLREVVRLSLLAWSAMDLQSFSASDS